jgi:hypothetical protein
MALLVRFTTAYNGQASFYTGTGTSLLVPDLYPIAIAGHNYLVDQKSGRFGRAFEARVRESVDQNNIPGEATINPQGLWRRSQVSWHKGSGQPYADSGAPLDYRFDTSKNVDPWTKNELKLLPTTSEVLSSANTNLFMAVAGDRLYVADGQDLKYTTDLSSWTTVTTGAVAADILSLTSDGFNVYIGYSGHGIHITDSGSSTITTYILGTENYTVQAYVKGRHMAAHGGEIHNFTASGSHTAGLLYNHPNSAFTFVGFAAGQQHIYAAGYAGRTSLIYRTAIKADGTSLDTPVQAGELPIGEVVSSIYGYLSYIIIGTNKGVRLASSDTNGDLVIGPILETTTSVKCAVGDGRFVWYGWTNFDGTSTGLGRLDLSELNGVNEPAYASDLMVTDQGAVNSVVNWNGTRVFSVSEAGLYKESTDLCAEGYVETGTWRWGIPDRKFLPRFDVRCLPLKGTITPSLNLDSAGYNDLTAVVTVGVTEKTVPGPQTGFSDSSIKITLARSGTNNTEGPTMTRWQARAYAAPIRARVFSIPIILHEKMNLQGREVYQDVKSELTFLENLVNDASIVSYQDAYDSYNVVVENVEWIPLDALDHGWEWEGTAVVTLKSIAD